MFRAFLAHHQEILYCLVSRSLCQTVIQSFIQGPAFNVTHFESRITHLLYAARNKYGSLFWGGHITVPQYIYIYIYIYI
jgi:hypothetical protein